jgi:hypothetical protein
MTFSEFTHLSLDQKCDAIWEWGFFLDRFKEPGLSRVLYSINGFFAEMCIRASDNQVIEVNCFLKISEELEKFYSINRDNPFVRMSVGSASH